MKLLRLGDAGRRADTKVFKQSVVMTIVGFLISAGLLGGFIYGYVAADLPLVMMIFAAILGVPITWFSFKTLVASLSAANWVMMIDQDGVRVKFTYFLRSQLYKGELQVVFIPFSEIRWARARHYTRRSSSRKGGVSFRADLELSVDPSRAPDIEKLREAMDRIRGLKKGGLVTPSPLSLGENVLLVRWKSHGTLVKPWIDKAVHALADHVEVREEDD